ncbi:hypothetical protein BD324DRAFT_680924 [Kockovaella imperatae]|uniref:Uncharacterized protein n=1 Tax=Kockovaella imperatae TaxID=4999 RepID=A0A1Y1UKN3_9TREE|nr:hypothetical protein BD324DRAFT_680924 [Kockovaella imperatae]ORX38064.1 hypothetical protein BD324DRAFT_680924 [Kockovaella imperatae]
MSVEPVKRKVAGTNHFVTPTWTATAGPSNPSQPRIRARVTEDRPVLRATKSSGSLRNTSVSPTPPVPPPPVPGFLPQARAKVNAFVRQRSQSPQLPIPPEPSAKPPLPSSRLPPRAKSPALRPVGYENGVSRLDRANGSTTPTGFMGHEMTRTKSAGAKSVIGEARARVKLPDATLHPLPNRTLSTPNYGSGPSTPNGPPQLRRPSIHSNRSSPGGVVSDPRFPKTPIDIHRLNPYLTTSRPPTPPLNPSLSSSRSSARALPGNGRNPLTPGTPSPDADTIILPIVTPSRNLEHPQLGLRKMSFDDASSGHRSSVDSYGWKSPTKPGPEDVVTSPSASSHNNRRSVEVVLSAEAEEARINRKIADLEISNASLLAINKSLEANKAKQRAEIQRLRGLLEEALTGSLDMSSTTVLFDNDLDDDELESGIADPALEERWSRIEELLGNMRREGERCVQESKSSAIGTGSKKVLDWIDLERPESPVDDESSVVNPPGPSIKGPSIKGFKPSSA